MAAIRERIGSDGGKSFHVQVRMSGFPARTGSFPTRRLAERWAKTVEAEMIEGKHFRNVEARRRTVGDAIDRYIADELPKKRNGGMHRVNLPHWKERLGNVKLADVTPALLVEHRGKLARETFTRAKPESKRSTVKAGEARKFKRSPQTVDRYMAVLRHVFTVARKEWHWISHDPFAGVSRLGRSNGRVRFLSDDERKRLFAETAHDPVLLTFVTVALATACRAGELLKLTWHDVDLTEKRLLFRETKNAQPRTAWLHSEALKQFRAHHDRTADTGPSQRVFQNSTGGMYGYDGPFKDALARASITDFRFHDLRHSAATYLAREGASEQQLRAIGGWKSGIVSKYVHIAAEDAREVLERMNNKVLGGG